MKLTNANPKYVALILVCAALLAPALRAEDTPYKVIKKIPLGGDGGWDYLLADAANRKLYIARNDRIMIVDMDTEKLTSEITGIDGAHGVAIVPELQRAFLTSGRDATVRVVDLKTLKETDRLKAGPKADAIVYEPVTKRVFAFNNQITSATVIDAAKTKVESELELGGNPEFGVTDGKGTIFVNLEDKSEIAVIDAATLKVTAHWPLTPGASPTGLALDVAHHRLFSGCRESKTLVVVDSENGKVIASLPIGAGVDAVAFDPDTQNAFSSNGDGTVTIVHEDDPATFKVTQTLETASGARTCTLDTKTHRLWLVTAETQPAPNDTVEQNRQHRVIVPGSFSAIVVGK